MSIDNSRISVVITCYSEGNLLKEAVNSVLQQSLKPLEIIIVNDASPHEETNRACTEVAQHQEVRLLQRDKNGGTSAARNSGFQSAQGEIIVPLDADDLLPKEAIALIHSAFSQSPNLGFVYGDYLREDRPDCSRVVKPGLVSLREMLQPKPWRISTNWQLIGTAPIRKSIWEKVGGYNTEFDNKDLHDVEFWIRVLAAGTQFRYIPELLYIWRKYLGSNSRKVTAIAWARIAYQHLNLYRQLGLETRAYELLLLGSKWQENTQEIAVYKKELQQSIRHNSLTLSSFIILLLPAKLVFMLGQILQKKTIEPESPY